MEDQGVPKAAADVTAEVEATVVTEVVTKSWRGPTHWSRSWRNLRMCRTPCRRPWLRLSPTCVRGQRRGAPQPRLWPMPLPRSWPTSSRRSRGQDPVAVAAADAAAVVVVTFSVRVPAAAEILAPWLRSCPVLLAAGRPPRPFLSMLRPTSRPMPQPRSWSTPWLRSQLTPRSGGPVTALGGLVGGRHRGRGPQRPMAGSIAPV